MNAPPKISVIMPAYNCERFISIAIDSVLAQTYSNIELIVIDDCSKDCTTSIVTSYVVTDSRIKLLINEGNLGVSKARNRGINAATGEYIAFLDADDVWVTDKLERQIHLARLTNADIIYTSYGFIDENGNPIKRPFLVPSSTNFNQMLRKNVIGNSTVLLRTAIAKRHPFRSDVQHEDYALWMELLSLPCQAAGCTDILTEYRQVTNARNANKLRAAKGRWNIYRNVLHLSMWKSIFAFCCYSISGVLKYYIHLS